MDYSTVDYYDEFACVAEKCTDTCCAGWQIMIDSESLQKYNEFEGAFGNRLHNSIDQKNQCFKQYHRRCAFLNEDNLCDLYMEAGKDSLCKTCREFPRHVEEFENYREISLSIACPEAARLLLSKTEPVQLKKMDDIEKKLGKAEAEEEEYEEYEDFDYLLFSELLDVRDVMFSIVGSKEASLSDKMGTVLALAHDFERRIYHNQLYLAQELANNYKERGIEAYREKRLREQKHCRSKKREHKMQMEITHRMFRQFYRLEMLEEDWMPLVMKSERILYEDGEKRYGELTKKPLEESKLQQVFWYFLHIYFLGAVYDGDPYDKVKLATLSTVLIRELLYARRAEKGTLSEEDYVDIVHRYAKEVEHSDLNIKKLEWILRKKRLFSIQNFVRII